ncbi:ras-related and estrogen-regulated growth inhibitor [Biomphalaria glabrata]|nr:ras-related and estrogen-regulated growth inhibitor [Biomphalaria glabrata]
MSQRRFTNAKIVILGGSAVGKTAFAVRYITKRYIGDYAPNTGKFIKVDMVTRVTCFTELKENKLEK